MHPLLKVALTLVAGTVLGLGLTWFTVVRGVLPGGVADGPWRTNLSIGSNQGGMAVRASVALHGLLALNRGETLYYTAATDDSGAALDGACTYRVAGRDPDARWWSITAYGPDDYLIPDAGHHYSVSKTSVAPNAAGLFSAMVSPAPADTGWIAVKPGRFSLTLRLYNPGPRTAADPAHAALPSIEKRACR
ncbi:MAG: DUF1214 domain-containing protein [Rhizomicrobium sp.]